MTKFYAVDVAESKTDLIPQKSPIDDKKLLHINVPSLREDFRRFAEWYKCFYH